MTTPGSPVPEGAYVPGTRFGQQHLGMDVDDAKAHLNVPVGVSFAHFEGFLPDIVRMLAGNYMGEVPAFQDGQLELNHRFDLMDNISGFAVAYLPYSYLQGASQYTYFTAPFNDRLGPQKNATVDGNGEITLTKGTWHLNCQMTTDTNDNNNNLFLRVEVLRPDGTVYSYKDVTHRITAGSDTTVQVFHPVVCPDDNYRVRARFRIWPGSILKTRVHGGTTSSHLAVNRLDLSTEKAVPAGTVPNGPDIN